MTSSWFRRLFPLLPRPSNPPSSAAVVSGAPPRVVDIDLYPDLDGQPAWTAEWGLLDDERMIHQMTSNDLSRLVEHVLRDARHRWGHYPDVTVQWSLHRSEDVTGTILHGVTLPVTLVV